uniref:Uncharacterized protein n=1 Tax=Cacopsylla melanoneura TaxID=428564 RepID=A0A8D8X8C3_9HEMI
MFLHNYEIKYSYTTSYENKSTTVHKTSHEIHSCSFRRTKYNPDSFSHSFEYRVYQGIHITLAYSGELVSNVKTLIKGGSKGVKLVVTVVDMISNEETLTKGTLGRVRAFLRQRATHDR